MPAEPRRSRPSCGPPCGRRGCAADDQALARRLTRLSEAIFTIQAARSLQELADAAAEGTARLTGSPAAVFFLGPDGELYRATSRDRTSLAMPDESAHRVVAGLLRRAHPRAAAGCRSPRCPRRCGPPASSGRAWSTTPVWC